MLPGPSRTSANEHQRTALTCDTSKNRRSAIDRNDLDTVALVHRDGPPVRQPGRLVPEVTPVLFRTALSGCHRALQCGPASTESHSRSAFQPVGHLPRRRTSAPRPGLTLWLTVSSQHQLSTGPGNNGKRSGLTGIRRWPCDPAFNPRGDHPTMPLTCENATSPAVR
jgi:hypothetical protein